MRELLISEVEIAVLALRARVVSCTKLRNWRRLSRSAGAIPSKRTRTPLAGPLRETTPLSAKPLTQILPLGTQRPISTFASRLDRSCGFHQTSARAGVGKIAPDGSRRFVDPKFDRHETLDSRMAAAVASPVGAEQIGFKWRRVRCWSRNWMRLRSLLRHVDFAAGLRRPP